MPYVIAYDIADDRRRNHVAQFLEGWGRRVQRSVFECNLSREEIEVIIRQVRAWLKFPEDRCHVYRVCLDCASHRIVMGSEWEPSMDATVVL